MSIKNKNNTSFKQDISQLTVQSELHARMQDRLLSEHIPGNITMRQSQRQELQVTHSDVQSHLFGMGENLKQNEHEEKLSYMMHHRGDHSPELAQLKIQESQNIRLMSDCKAFFTFCRGMIGSGVLLQAKGFVNGGWAFSTAILFFSVIVEIYCLYIVILIRKKFKGTFSDLGQISFGAFGKFITDVMIVLCQYNGLFAYSAFVTLHVKQAVSQWSDTEGGSIWYYGLGFLIIIVPLIWVRQLERLAFFHIFGNLMVILVMITVVVFSAYNISEKDGIDPDVVAFNPSDFSLYFGSAVFAFEGVALIIPVYDAMENKSHLNSVLISSMIFISFVTFIMGIMPYISFGPSGIQETFITQQIAATYDHVWWNKILNLLYAVALTGSFIVNAYPAIQIIERCLLKGRVPAQGVSLKRTWCKNFIRAMIAVIAILVAMFTTSSSRTLDLFISYLATISLTPIAFLLPAAFHWKLVATKTWQKVVDLLIIIFGSVAMVGCVLVTAIKD